MEQLCPTWTDFHECYLRIIKKYAGKIKVRLKSDKKSGTLHVDLRKFIGIWRSILLRMGNVLENFVERIKTHFMFKNHHHISVIELGHLLTRSGFTYPKASSKVYHDSFCQLGNGMFKNRFLKIIPFMK
jgi:hypothetical protein